VRPQSAQALSYFPEVLYRHGRHDQAFATLMELAGPDFFGRDIAEVAFAVIGAVATGLMGLTPNAPQSGLSTVARLPKGVEWARLSRIPVMGNEITVEHRGGRETILTNHSGPAIAWTSAKVEVKAGESRPARLGV
jgi:hypothetical protein